jgi:hypothetical protein
MLLLFSYLSVSPQLSASLSSATCLFVFIYLPIYLQLPASFSSATCHCIFNDLSASLQLPCRFSSATLSLLFSFMSPHFYSYLPILLLSRPPASQSVYHPVPLYNSPPTPSPPRSCLSLYCWESNLAIPSSPVTNNNVQFFVGRTATV